MQILALLLYYFKSSGSRRFLGRPTSRSASSSRINDLLILEDTLAANVVLALLDRRAFDQVHLASKDGRQFVLHGDQIEQTHPRIGRKRHQHVDIALAPEILSQRGAKDRHLADAMAAAEVGDLVLGDFDLYACHVGKSTPCCASPQTPARSTLVKFGIDLGLLFFGLGEQHPRLFQRSGGSPSFKLT